MRRFPLQFTSVFFLTLGAAVMSAPRSSWSKRVNASSGGLHPVESYVFLPPTLTGDLDASASGSAALFHYCPVMHGLEQRRLIPPDVWKSLSKRLALPENSFLLALSSVNWREIWKYGERGFRYCQLDIGHAAGSVLLSCMLLGWRVKPLNIGADLAGFSDDIFGQLLGFEDGTFAVGEEESPALLFCVAPKEADLRETGKKSLKLSLLNELATLQTKGKPNLQSWKVRSAPACHRSLSHPLFSITTGILSPPLLPRQPTSPPRQAGWILRFRRRESEWHGWNLSRLRARIFAHLALSDTGDLRSTLHKRQLSTRFRKRSFSKYCLNASPR